MSDTDHDFEKRELPVETTATPTTTPQLARPESSTSAGEQNGDVDIEKAGQLTDLEKTTDSKERDPNIVDYDGPDDPQNPYNWPKSKKWVNGGLLSAMTFVT